MATEATNESPLIVRAKKDHERDRLLIEEATAQANVADLSALCSRLLTERRQLAAGMDAMIQGWQLLRDGTPQTTESPNLEVIASIERVAHEAIAFAREVVQTFKPERGAR